MGSLPSFVLAGKTMGAVVKIKSSGVERLLVVLTGAPSCQTPLQHFKLCHAFVLSLSSPEMYHERVTLITPVLFSNLDCQ